jgi:hypothetical protein
MSLSERLTLVSNKERKTVLCKLGELMAGTELQIEDRDHLIAAVLIPSGDPRRISSDALSHALEEEGISVSGTSITRHRLKRCSCFKRGTE